MNRRPGGRSTRRRTPHARLLRQLTGELRSLQERLDELTDQMTAPSASVHEELTLDDPGTGAPASTDDAAIDLADGETSDLLRRRAIVYARLRERLRTTLMRVI